MSGKPDDFTEAEIKELVERLKEELKKEQGK